MDIIILGILWTLCIMVIVVLLYIYFIKEKIDYKKAKLEIFAYVGSYKNRVSGSNRFVITVDILQNIFREYDTEVINKVWIDLINERVIEQDPYDNVWCVK